MKDSNMGFSKHLEVIRRMEKQLQPTKRFLDLMDETAAIQKHIDLVKSSAAMSSSNALARLAREAAKQQSLFAGLDGTYELMEQARHLSALPHDQIASFNSALESATSSINRFQSQQVEQLAAFEKVISGAMPRLSAMDNLFRVGDQFAEFVLPAHRIVDLAAELRIDIGLDVARLEGGRDKVDEDESPIILPEEVRQSLIEVRGIPAWLLTLILRDPGRVLRGLNWRQFEEYIAHLCEQLGGTDVYLTRNASKGDHGLDVVGRFVVDEITTVFGFQCKKYDENRKVKGSHVRELSGALSIGPHGATRGVLCTTSSYEPQAREYFLQSVELDGWEPDDFSKFMSGERAFD